MPTQRSVVAQLRRTPDNVWNQLSRRTFAHTQTHSRCARMGSHQQSSSGWHLAACDVSEKSEEHTSRSNQVEQPDVIVNLCDKHYCLFIVWTRFVLHISKWVGILDAVYFKEINATSANDFGCGIINIYVYTVYQCILKNHYRNNQNLLHQIPKHSAQTPKQSENALTNNPLKSIRLK